MTALALAVSLSGMPELIGLYNENKLASPHLLRQRGKAPLHVVQPQVRGTSHTLHAGHWSSALGDAKSGDIWLSIIS